MTIYINEQEAESAIDNLLTSVYTLGDTSTINISIYKGTMPTNIDSGWVVGDYASDLLITYTNVGLSQPGATQPVLALATFPTITNAVGTGTASWGAIWKTGSTTIVIIGNVGVPSGSPPTCDAMIILDDLSFTTGVPHDILDLKFTMEHM